MRPSVRAGGIWRLLSGRTRNGWTEPTLSSTGSVNLPSAALSAAAFLGECRQLISATESLTVSGKLTRVTGMVLEASGLRLAVGNCCRVLLPNGNSVEAEVVGFSEDR